MIKVDDKVAGSKTVKSGFYFTPSIESIMSGMNIKTLLSYSPSLSLFLQLSLGREASIPWQDCRNRTKLHKAAVEEVQTGRWQKCLCRKGGQTLQQASWRGG